MPNIWGKLKEPTCINLTSSSPGKTITKPEIRQQVWDFLEKFDLVNFPRPVHHRIPHFKGAPSAGQMVATLPEFKNCSVVKVNPDKPQEEVRYQVLDHKKLLLVPTPRLSKGLFNRLENPGGSTDKQFLRKLASRQGIDNHSKPLPMTSHVNIDMVVIGSVAVDKSGHRIGKGEGFADLEFAIASSLGYINPDTVVVATVHDCQLFESLPESLFDEHDISVDIIVTPTSIHRVEKRLPKPTQIIWRMLSMEKFRKVPILKEMRVKDSKLGKDVRLKEEFEGEKSSVKEREEKQVSYDKPVGKVSSGKAKERKEDNSANNNYAPNDASSTKTRERGKNAVEDVHCDKRPLLYIGKIPRDVRVRDLKSVLLDRGVRPRELVWKGFKGYAFIYFDVSENVEEIYQNLKDLKIGESTLDIQKEKMMD